MALTMPTYIDQQCYTGERLRSELDGLVCTEGVGAFTEIAVTQSVVPAMSVDVSAGHAFIANDEATDQMYHVYNDAVETLEISDNTSGSTRIDLIVIQVCDSQYSVLPAGGDLVVIEGTPGAGAPSLPADDCTYYLLAEITVANGETTITGTPTSFGGSDGEIEDTRTGIYGLCSGGVGLGEWVSYTPTYTGFTPNGASATTRYCRIGNMVTVRFYYEMTGASTTMAISLPFPDALTNSGSVLGSCKGLDGGNAYFDGNVEMGGPGPDQVTFKSSQSAANVGQWNATFPFTWAANDVLSGTFTYEAA